MSSGEKHSGINWGRVMDLPGMRSANDGSPDVPAILRFLEEELVTFISKNEIPIPEIAEALDKVWDKHPFTNFDLKGLTHRALDELTVEPGAETMALKRITEYVRAQSALFKKGGDGKWLINVGNSARIQRVTTAFADEYWDKQEAKAAKRGG